MKRFDINDYKGNYAMHCKTEEEAREFCNYLHGIGSKWRDGNSYANYTSHFVYEGNTAYAFNKGEYCSVRFYRSNGYTILNFSDFDWSKEFTKADLKTGDVVLRRNGNIEIFIRDMEIFITGREWNSIHTLTNDLRDIDSENEWDIMKVRRPKKNSDCCLNAFKYDFGTLIYERKEVEEMTLAEVCKLLGKEIKIIK